MALTLKENGYDAKILVEDKSYAKPVWLDESYDVLDVVTIKEDKIGQYWISTQGSGIIILDREFKFVQQITTSNKLPSNNVYDFIINDISDRNG